MIGQNCLLDDIYPVGSIYMNINDTNPSNLFGGEWTQLQDRFLLAAGSRAANLQGGAETVTLSKNNLPEHEHILATQKHTGTYSVPQWALAFAAGTYEVMDTEEEYSQTDFSCGLTGTSSHTYNAPFSIMPPFLTVYMWMRVS